MNILGLPLTAISLLPFWLLHLMSDLTYVLIFHVMGYRKKVVLQNLRNSFPEKPDTEIFQIRKEFYRNFCDLIFETIKTFTISKDELTRRCRVMNSELVRELYAAKKNVAGISSHMGNWEWLSLSLSLESPFRFLAVYKPLANLKLNDLVIRSRQRFGAQFVAIKNLKSVLDESSGTPYLVGLLSDQAPHDYSKAFEIPFLNQPSFFVPGPGVLSVQRNLVPIFGWIRRVGRSRYEWWMETLNDEVPPLHSLSEHEQQQIHRFSKSHGLSVEESLRAWGITRQFAHRLEEEIKMAPQDWLWSHRRWKSR